MVGDAQRRPAFRRAHVVGAEEFGDIACDGGEPGCPVGIFAVALQQMAVVLHGGAAARRVDHHRVHRLAFVDEARPGVDVALGHGDGRRLAPHMMHKRAAAAGAWCYLHIDTAPSQQADGGIVDLRPQHLLGAPGEQDHALAPLPFG